MIALPFLLLVVTMYLTAILVSNLNSLWETSIQNFSFYDYFSSWRCGSCCVGSVWIVFWSLDRKTNIQKILFMDCARCWGYVVFLR